MTNDGKSKQGKAKQEPQVLPNSLVGIDWRRIYTGRPPTMCPQCHEMDVPYTCIHAETAVSGRISVGSCSQKKDKSVWYARRVGSIALLVFIRVYVVSSAVFDYLRLDRLMWLPDARYLRTPSSLIALGSQADRQKANESSFAIIKPCYKNVVLLHLLSRGRVLEREAANPSPSLAAGGGALSTMERIKCQ